MAEVIALTTPQLDAMRQSFADIARLALLPPETLLQLLKSHSSSLFLKRLVSGDEISDLAFAKREGGTATGTRFSHVLQCDPADEYLELFAALAAVNGNARTVICHGWPVLSPVSGRSHRMAEGGAESICAAGGQ